MQIPASNSKKERKISENAMDIYTWLIKLNSKAENISEFTDRVVYSVKEKTGIKLPEIVSKVVGLGNIIVKYHDKVFYIIYTANWPVFEMNLT